MDETFQVGQFGPRPGHDNEMGGGKESVVRFPRRDLRKGIQPNHEMNQTFRAEVIVKIF
jgi:hypothetical protein